MSRDSYVKTILSIVFGRVTMGKWRPDGYKNPYPKSSKGNFGLGSTTVYGWEHDIYEAGADAMLEALRKEGQHLKPFGYESGTVVFILDDPPDDAPIDKS